MQYTAVIQLSTVGLGWAALGYDAALIGVLLANELWLEEFGWNKTLLGFVIASFVLGCTVSSIPAGYLGDKIGRRRTILIGCLANIVFIFLETFSVNWQMFIASRFLSGFSVAFTVVNAGAYLNESCNRHRAHMGALAPTFFYVGSIPAAWTAYGALPIASSWSWRIVLIIQLVFSFTQLAFALACPESPQWLFVQGRTDQAQAVLRKTFGGSSGEIEEKIIETLQAFGEAPIAEGSWQALLFHTSNRRRLFITVLLAFLQPWLGSGIISWYLAPFLGTLGIQDNHQQAAINGGLQVMNLLVAVGCALQIDRFGRRALLLVSTTGMLLCMVVITTCAGVYATTPSGAASVIAVIAVFLFYCTYDIGFAQVPAMYVTELAPIELRMKIPVVSGLASGSAMVMNQWLNPIALDALGWEYLLVSDACLVFMLVSLYLTAPETKGMTLEEASRACDVPWSWWRRSRRDGDIERIVQNGAVDAKTSAETRD